MTRTPARSRPEGPVHRSVGVAAALLAVGGCTPLESPAPGPPPAELAVVAEPETASVYVNERFAGTATVLAARPEKLVPGVHFVTIRAPGFFPHDLRLELPPGRTTVRIRLRPIPP